MARDDAARSPDSEQSLLDRRSYLKMATAAVAGVAGASGAASGASYDTITVPAGSHRTISIGAGETFENTIVDITASGASVEFQAFEDNWTLRNVAVRGSEPTGDRYMMRCEAQGECRIENCYFGDGDVSDEYGNYTGIYVGRNSSGTLTVQNVYMANFSDNALYASDMGAPDAGAFSGSQKGTLVVRDSYFENNMVSSVRLGTDTSRAENCVVNGGPHRGFWVYWNTPSCVDCDSSADRPFEVGEPVHDDIRQNPVELTLKDCRATGGEAGVNPKGVASVEGTPAPNPRTSPPSGVPATPEEAASGSTSSSNDTRTSGSSSSSTNEPTDSDSKGTVLELIADEDTANVTYEFTVDGSLARHSAGETIAAEQDDTLTDNGDGTVTASGLSGMGYGDAFLVDGSITSMDLAPSEWTLRYGGSETSVEDLVADGGDSASEQNAGRSNADGSNAGGVFELVAGEDTRNAAYEFTVDGSVTRHSASNTVAAEQDDTFTDNGDGTVTVTGRAGLGYGDAFLVDGSITSVDLDPNEWTLRYDGSEVSVDDFGRSDPDPTPTELELIADEDAANVTYEFTVEGSVSRHATSDEAAAEENDTISENADGTVSVSGLSGMGYGDAFVVEGKITSMNLDENVWTVRYGGSEVSVGDVVAA
jgi:hypothetical protein